MTIEAWSKLSLATQLANICVELGRADRFSAAHDEPSRDRSLDRALELADCSLAIQHGLTRRRELARLRELIAGTLLTSHNQGINIARLRQLLSPTMQWSAHEKVR